MPNNMKRKSRKKTIAGKKSMIPKKINSENQKIRPAEKKKISLKKKIPKGVVFAIGIILIFSGLFLAYSILLNNNTPKSKTIYVYFINKAKNKLEKEKVTIYAGEKKDEVQSVMQALMNGPSSSSLSKTELSKDMISDIYLNPNEPIAEIVFSRSYENLSASESVFLRTSLVWSLTELEYIRDIRFYLGDKELSKTNGQALGIQNRDNVLIDTQSLVTDTESLTIKLYFSDAMGEGLVEETRVVEINPNVPEEKYIIEELFKGPQNTELIQLIPQGTKLIRVKTEAKTCYVDFNQDFFTKLEAGSTTERLVVYSIVNSLTQLDGVKKVQFLIEGDRVTTARDGHMDLSFPFEINTDIIKK